MSAWDELSAKYKVGATAAKPDTAEAPKPDQVDVWRTLAATHRMPRQTVNSQKPDNSDFGQRMQKIVLDMPYPEKVAAAFGAGLNDTGQRVKQIFGNATEKDVDKKRKLDSFLTNDPLSGAARFAGEYVPGMVLPTGLFGKVMTKFAPRLAPIVEGAVQGGVGGAIQPVGTGESGLFNTLAGATLGGVAPGIGVMARGAVGNASPEAAALAKKAIEQYKVPLQASDITNSNFMRQLNSMFSDMPITGGIAAAKRDAKQVAFNRGVGKTFGADADRLTADVVQNAHRKMTGTFDDIYSRNPADAFQINNSLAPVLARLGQEGTDEQKRFIYSRLNELNNNIDDATGTINGKFFNGWQSSLGKAAGNDPLKNEFRKAAISGYNSGLSGADADLLNQTRAQYRNFKTINPLLEKAPTGDISPGLLQGRVASNFSDYSRGGGGELGDLARIGSRFMVDRTPQMGGSGRGMLQNSVLLNTLAVPTVAPLSMAMNSNVMRDAIINKSLGTGLFDTTPALGLLGDAASRVATQALPAYVTGGLLSY